MKKLIIILGCLFSLFSQANQSQSYIEKIVYSLASKDSFGRAPGTPGHNRSLDFLKDQLVQLHFMPEVQAVERDILFPIKNLYIKIPAENNTSLTSYHERRKQNDCLALVAHYDHVGGNADVFYPGAMDNAASVAVLFNLLKKLKEKPIHMSSDLYFVFPDAEEKNLQGSFYFVPELKKMCSKIKMNITLDVLGSPFFVGMENQLLLLGAESSRDLVEILPPSNDNLNIHSGPIYLVEPLNIPRSDYANFRLHHIPFIFLTDGTPWNYHTPWDTADRLDYSHLESVSTYLYQLLKKFSLKENSLSFHYRSKAPPHFRKSALEVSQIIHRYLEKRVENFLDEDDISLFQNDLKLISQRSVERAQLNKVVVDLLRSIKSKQKYFAPH